MNKKMMSMLVLLMVVIAGCGNNQAKENQPEQDKNNTPAQTETTLKVATLIPPMTEILDVVKPLLKEEGLTLRLLFYPITFSRTMRLLIKKWMQTSSSMSLI